MNTACVHMKKCIAYVPFFLHFQVGTRKEEAVPEEVVGEGEGAREVTEGMIEAKGSMEMIKCTTAKSTVVTRNFFL